MMHVMTGGGNAIVEPFKKALVENNVELMLETPATKLLKDNNGNITGAIVENEGKELKIKAKAVVLATGATVTSNAIMDAVKSALESAKK